MRAALRTLWLAGAVVLCLPAGAQAAWQRLPDLSSAVAEVDELSLAVSPSGTAIATWVQDVPPGPPFDTVLMAAVRERDGAFGPPQAVPRSRDPGFVGLAMSRRGEAFAGWPSHDATFFGATRLAGAGFGPGTRIRPGADIFAVHGMGYDRAGTLYVLYSGTVRRRNRAGLLVRRSGSGFAIRLLPGPNRLIADNLTSAAPPLALEGRGGLTVLVRLRGSSATHPYLGVQRRTPGGRLGVAQRLQRLRCTTGDEGRESCDLDGAEVAAADGGAALAAWCVGGRTSAVRAAQRRSATAPFGRASTLSRARGGCFPVVRMGSRGDGVVAWEGAGRVRAVLRSRRGALSAPRALGSSTDDPVAAVARSGHAVVAWREPRGTLRASVRRPGRGFAPARTLADDVPAGAVIRTAVDAAGRAVVAYVAPGRDAPDVVRALAYTP